MADAISVGMTAGTVVSRSESDPVEAPPAPETASDAREARQSVIQAPDQQRSRRRRLVFAALGALVLAVACILGVPWVLASLNTVSTDDAYVNGHVTLVAPRVAGQIARVLVDDNNRVHKGEVLAVIDKEPFEDAVAVKQAAVNTAEANLRAAEAATRDIEAQARAGRWQLQNAVQNVDNQIALLHARVAALDKSKAELTLAQADFYRARQLLGTPGESRQEFDRAQGRRQLGRNCAENRRCRRCKPDSVPF